ncbi:hypothetical protein KR054_000634, partial [Drosophila jambulina]
TQETIIDISDLDALIQPFSGDNGYSVFRWIDDFSNIMDIYGVSEKKCIIFAKRLLTGSARAFMNETAALNWSRLRAELISVFDLKITAF